MAVVSLLFHWGMPQTHWAAESPFLPNAAVASNGSFVVFLVKMRERIGSCSYEFGNRQNSAPRYLLAATEKATVIVAASLHFRDPIRAVTHLVYQSVRRNQLVPVT